MNCLGSLACLVLMQQAPGPIDMTHVSISRPVVVAELRSDRQGGFPVRLSWSPDGGEFYIRFVERDRWGNESVQHVLVSTKDGAPRAVDREPTWASAYWMRKSAYFCPGAVDFSVAVETRTERRTPTSAGSSGSAGQNSGDPYAPGFELGPQGQAIMASAMQAQNVTITTMKVRGQLVSEFVNTEAIPGLMYGWAPEGFTAIAFTDRKRRLLVQGQSGKGHEVPDSRNVLLPAWSDDGRMLAWVEQRGRGLFLLHRSSIANR